MYCAKIDIQKAIKMLSPTDKFQLSPTKISLPYSPVSRNPSDVSHYTVHFHHITSIGQWFPYKVDEHIPVTCCSVNALKRSRFVFHTSIIENDSLPRILKYAVEEKKSLGCIMVKVLFQVVTGCHLSSPNSALPARSHPMTAGHDDC